MFGGCKDWEQKIERHKGLNWSKGFSEAQSELGQRRGVGAGVAFEKKGECEDRGRRCNSFSMH